MKNLAISRGNRVLAHIVWLRNQARWLLADRVCLVAKASSSVPFSLSKRHEIAKLEFGRNCIIFGDNPMAEHMVYAISSWDTIVIPKIADLPPFRWGYAT